MSIKTSLATVANAISPQRPWWRVVLTTGKEVSERGMVFRDGIRPIDWSLDLITTGDILKVKEIWLMFPQELSHYTCIEKGNPIHQRIDGKISSAVLPIKERGCVFQMKIKSLDGSPIAMTSSTFECQIIGAVGNKETGECHCYIWDRMMGLVAYKTSVYDFGTWRESIAKIANISHTIVGLNLA